VSGTIDFVVNGRPVSVTCNGTAPLLSVLRDELALRSAKFGCGTEQCGACIVLIDGSPAYSCAREISTIAGKAAAGAARRAGRPVRLLPPRHCHLGHCTP
jgi:aerobic-type carbon monoxide dehydrogenase small subunit (CoxS/CutS family)